MANREIEVNIKRTEHFVRLFNGIFDLTKKEMQVMSAFIDQYVKLQGTGISAFSTESKKAVAKRLKMDDYNALNIYLQKLVKKRVIVKNDEYEINPLLLPLRSNEENIVWILKKK